MSFWLKVLVSVEASCCFLSKVPSCLLESLRADGRQSRRGQGRAGPRLRGLRALPLPPPGRRAAAAAARPVGDRDRNGPESGLASPDHAANSVLVLVPKSNFSK